MQDRGDRVGCARLWRAATVVPVAIALLFGSGTTAASAATETFDYTGAAQTWTVPAGVTTATFDVYGAGGASGNGGTLPQAGGGRATVTIPVTPLGDIGVYVGGSGFSGGFNGGGAGGFMGGGASDIRIGGSVLADRAIVAGGGGGATTNCTRPDIPAGGGGGLNGGDGFFNNVCFSLFGAQPGTGGTQTQGGTNPGAAGAAGALGVGGPGSGSGGGGGGGGYYGGAGGYNTGGAGGGSGFGPAGTRFETGTHTGDGEIVITYGPSTPNLAVDTAGTGSGFVSSSPAGIDCETGSGAHTDCAETYSEGDAVILTANPGPNSSFESWSGGGCSGSAPTCTVEMDRTHAVTATFGPGFDLTTSTSGTGSGFVSSNPAGIDCETGSATHTGCSAAVNAGAQVTLIANPAASSSFTGWSGGGCSGIRDHLHRDDGSGAVGRRCLHAPHLRARCLDERQRLRLVSSNPAGIDCETGSATHTDCTETFDHGTSVTLTANPAASSSSPAGVEAAVRA